MLSPKSEKGLQESWRSRLWKYRLTALLNALIKVLEKHGRLPHDLPSPVRASVQLSGKYLSHKDSADGSCNLTED
jgi:hypothetical protein